MHIWHDVLLYFSQISLAEVQVAKDLMGLTLNRKHRVWVINHVCVSMGISKNDIIFKAKCEFWIFLYINSLFLIN